MLAAGSDVAISPSRKVGHRAIHPGSRCELCWAMAEYCMTNHGDEPLQTRPLRPVGGASTSQDLRLSSMDSTCLLSYLTGVQEFHFPGLWILGGVWTLKAGA